MTKRALWLLNHTTLRRFEVPLLRELGYEVYLPKTFPADEGNVSASVDYSYDAFLTIPPDHLERLNAHDFYGPMSPDVAEILNAHFDLAIFAFFPVLFESMVRSFGGTLVLRPFGLPQTNYTEVTRYAPGPSLMSRLRTIEHRFWFGQAYAHLSAIEVGIFRRRALTLPIGLPPRGSPLSWTGSEAQLLFVCPRIRTSPYDADIYDAFRKDFGDLPHKVLGAQPIAVADKDVTGFLPREDYDKMMQGSRVMFYHSREPYHLHYHPLEAVEAGLPLVFMAGGMLDRLGGATLPGRCRSVSEARSKIRRLLDGDLAYADTLRGSQRRLLDAFAAEPARAAWRSAIARFAADTAAQRPTAVEARKRVAVLIPREYRGGTLRGAKLVAEALERGARMEGYGLDVVFGYLEGSLADDELDGLPETIARRPFRWKILNAAESARACVYAGVEGAVAPEAHQAPDDGIRQFLDCDLWLVISDRLELPLLPVRPHLLLVYDYLQRYVLRLDDKDSRNLIQRAHAAEAVLVTTDFTARDALHYAGIAPARIRKVPMLAPDFAVEGDARSADRQAKDATYFLWTTNLGPHKNHLNALKALQRYYDDFGGTLTCQVTGVDSARLLEGGRPATRELRAVVDASASLRRGLTLLGELPDWDYRRRLREAAFLWHPALIDNGTFAVAEAAHYGVPALASDYPAMREIDEQFGLNLSWMDPHSPTDMARQLAQMERDLAARTAAIPSRERLASQSPAQLAKGFWEAVREHL